MDHNDGGLNEVTAARFAEIRGVTEGLVSRWRKNGLLKLTADGSRVYVRESLASLDAALDPGRGGDRTGKAGGQESESRSNYTVEAAREKRARAQLAELELAEKAGQLMPRLEAEALVFNLVGSAKKLLLGMPSRLAQPLSVESDEHKVEQLLEREVRAVCEALAGAAIDEDQAAA